MKSISKTKELLNSKQISAVELTQEYLKKATESTNNAFVTITQDVALKQAAESDKKIANGTAGKLEGIPCAIKDVFCTKDVLTTCSSKMLSNFIPPYESTVTDKLFAQGAVMIGKANMDEFAMGSMTTNSYYGASINPHRDARFPEKTLTPGGSSGGSAVSVAEGSSIFATGTDTGGSTRQPAAFCGIVGVKPSYGTVSRYGMIAYASSLDQAGIFANNVEDSALLLDIISGFDQKDSTSLPNSYRKFSSFGEKMKNGVKGLKIGVPKEYIIDGMHPDIIAAFENTKKHLEQMGAQIIEISLPNAQLGIATYYALTTAEASSNLARFDGVKYGVSVRKDGDTLADIYANTRGECFGEEVKRRICLGNFVLSSGKYEEYYVQAMKVRQMIKNDFDAAFTKCDAILSPITPNLAFAIDEKPTDPVVIYLNDILAVGVNLAGLPGISVPVGISQNEKLPIGMQIIGNYLDDATMMQVAFALESIIPNYI